MQIEQSDIYVVGGANIDFLVLPFGEKLEYASLPSKIQRFFGGVARNIAENLAYLNMKTSLITAISKDKDGRELAQDCVKKTYIWDSQKLIVTIPRPNSLVYRRLKDNSDMHFLIWKF